MVPKDQIFQQMMMMQPPRRNDDVPSELIFTNLKFTKFTVLYKKICLKHTHTVTHQVNVSCPLSQS